MNFLKTLDDIGASVKALSFAESRYNEGMVYSRSYSSDYNWEREVGDVLNNSVVMATAKVKMRMFIEAPCVVESLNEDNRWAKDWDHPLMPVLWNPHPLYTQSLFWAENLLKYDLDGNAYVFIERNLLDEPMYLVPFPYGTCWPVAENGEALSYYKYIAYPGAEEVRIDPRDVIHFRNGYDPNNRLLGMSPFKALVRSVATDNELDLFIATVLRNKGWADFIIGPDGADTEIDEDEAQKIKDFVEAKTTRDNRGRPLIMSRPFKYETPGLKPADLVLDVLRRIPETRIPGSMGVPSVIANLYTGTEAASLSNVRTLREFAYLSGIMPEQTMMAEFVTQKLVPSAPNTFSRTRIRFDTSEVYALQELRHQIHERYCTDFTRGITTRNESRAKLGFKPIEDGKDGFYEELFKGGVDQGGSPTFQGNGNGNSLTGENRKSFREVLIDLNDEDFMRFARMLNGSH